MSDTSGIFGWAKRIIKPLVPRRLRRWRRRIIDARRQEQFAELAVETTFARIYETNEWGGERGTYYSGPGSERPLTEGYVDAITRYVRENGVRTIVDLGCGDFRVGAELAASGAAYVGVDVVPTLVAHNQATYGRAGVRFECRDIIRDDLPDGDLCLVRQVLQHLSNAEIARVLGNCRRYPHLVITEHLPPEDSRPVPNVDMPHGPGIRLTLNSGVYVDRPPFALQRTRVLHEVSCVDGSVVRSVLVEQGEGA